jgi:hypothetical protein|tara:strand:- start:775 stop:1272 length:498 start_codon:yes stop_codon:yes gene_type:complete
MKNFIFFTLLAFLIFGCSSKSVRIDKVQVTKEASEFISSQFDFFSNSSLDEAKMTFSEDAVLIGTDAAEYLTGWSEIEPSVKGQFVIKDPVFSSRNLNIFLSDDGSMASYTQITDFTFSIDGEPGEMKNIRNSGVIRKTNSMWKLIQIHWSIGLEGQAVEYDIEE